MLYNSAPEDEPMTVRSCPLSRREFSAALCSLPAASMFGAQERAQLPWNQPASVARVFVASPTVHWPKPDLDVERDRAEVEARMSEVARKHAQAHLRQLAGMFPP
jgi:hypothetical protein